MLSRGHLAAGISQALGFGLTGRWGCGQGGGGAPLEIQHIDGGILPKQALLDDIADSGTN